MYVFTHCYVYFYYLNQISISIMRYFIRLAYNGSNYHGWQRQPNDSSVQQCIEDALSTILRIKIEIVGAGRTDTGVNASTMYAHFDFDTIDNAKKEKLIVGLNSILGRNIAIYDIIPVRYDAHARFDAKWRTYHYYTHISKSPFIYPLSWQAPKNLDYDAMNEAAKLLLKTDDFTSFAKLHTDAVTNICKVTKAEWVKRSDCDGYVFIITANRFLRNMVRAIVGTLVDVGRGKITISDFQKIIDLKNRCDAGVSMPGNALFLHDIVYPEDIFITPV